MGSNPFGATVMQRCAVCCNCALLLFVKNSIEKIFGCYRIFQKSFAGYEKWCLIKKTTQSILVYQRSMQISKFMFSIKKWKVQPMFIYAPELNFWQTVRTVSGSSRAVCKLITNPLPNLCVCPGWATWFTDYPPVIYGCSFSLNRFYPRGNPFLSLETAGSAL